MTADGLPEEGDDVEIVLRGRVTRVVMGGRLLQVRQSTGLRHVEVNPGQLPSDETVVRVLPRQDVAS